MQKNAWSGTSVSGVVRTLFFVMFETFGVIIFSYGQGDVSVNLFTGAPQIMVPLGGVSDHDLSDAFALRYVTQGVSVKTPVGFYGVGWDLAGGSRVSRQVRGLPDDLNETGTAGRKGWLNSQTNVNAGAFGNTADGNATTCSDELADYNALRAFGYNVDTEPDIFYYSVGNISGSFVFDNSSTPQMRLMPYNDVKIEPQFTSGKITGFLITTNDGVLYELNQIGSTVLSAVKYAGSYPIDFGKTEYEQYKQPVAYNDSWSVKKVTSPTGAILNYTYENVTYGERYSGYDHDNTTQVWLHSNYSYHYRGDYMYKSNRNTTVSRLKSVSGSSGARIDFTYSGYGADSENKGILTAVSLRNSHAGSTAFKSFQLNYIYYGCTERCTDASEDGVSYDYTDFSRAFLQSITESGGSIQAPPYRFFYKAPEKLPMPNSMAVDFWGYYNGVKTNAHRVPTLYIYPQLDPAERYRVYPIANYVGEQYTLKAADLMVNSATVQTGLLQIIQYPAGGRKILEYEPNEFYDAVAGQSFPAAGVRVKSITTEDGINAAAASVQQFTYTRADGKSSGRILYMPSFAVPLTKYINPADSSFVVTKEDLISQGLNPWLYLTARVNINLAPNEGIALYTRVRTSVAGKGYTVTEYSAPGTWGAAATDLWEPSLVKFARPADCPSMGFFTTASVGIYPYFSSPNMEYDRGLVLNSRTYNELNALVHERIYTYQYLYRPGTPLPTKVWGVQYHKFPNASGFHYAKYGLLTDFTKVLASETETAYDALNSGKAISTTREVFYESQYHRLPTRTRSVASDGTVYTTYAKYPLDYGAVPAGADKSAEMIGKLQSAFRNGMVIEQYATSQPSGGAVSVQGASLITYDDFGSTKPLVKQQRQLVGLPLSAFGFSSINASSKALEYNVNYEIVSTIKAYDSYDVPTSVVGMSRAINSTAWGYNSSLPIAQVAHAAADEFAFSDFETTTARAFDLQGGSMPTGSGAATYSIGHTGVNAVYPTTRLRKVIARGADRYILSGWLNPQQTTVGLTVKIMNSTATTTHYTKNISFETPAGNAYRYFEYIIPIPAGLTSFLVEVTGTYSAVVNGKTPGLDDIAFYPEHADLSSFTYTIPFGVREQTVRDKTVMTEYDKLGRVIRRRDIDNNIVQQTIFIDPNNPLPLPPVDPPPTLEPSFTYTGALVPNAVVTFTAEDLGIPGATYRWRVKSFWVGTGRTLSYQFPTIGIYPVCLEVEEPGGLSGLECISVKIVSGPLD